MHFELSLVSIMLCTISICYSLKHTSICGRVTDTGVKVIVYCVVLKVTSILTASFFRLDSKKSLPYTIYSPTVFQLGAIFAVRVYLKHDDRVLIVTVSGP